MKIGHYLDKLINLVKEGWKFLFEDTQKIEAHHLVALLITIAIIYLLSYIVSKIFKTVVKIVIMTALVWLLWMFLFDRKKYNELFCKEKHDDKGGSNTEDN